MQRRPANLATGRQTFFVHRGYLGSLLGFQKFVQLGQEGLW